MIVDLLGMLRIIVNIVMIGLNNIQIFIIFGPTKNGLPKTELLQLN